MLFASVVDAPSAHPAKCPTEVAQQRERERLFDIIRRMMQKKLHEHPEVYALARDEMLRHCDGKLPPVLDPFAGGGSIPLEAARLGFEAHAADLNPVAVLLNKCNLELVPRWLDHPPVNPEATFLGARPSRPQNAAELSRPQNAAEPSRPQNAAEPSRPPNDPAVRETLVSRPHKQWHSRGYLPHFDHPGLVQSITFRLHDSLPAHVIETWRKQLNWNPSLPADDPRAVEMRKRIDTYEDAGHGACFLRDDRVAQLVEDALLHFDGQRYRLLEWCIMPNHVHVLIEALPGHRLGDLVHSWKSFTAKEANRILGRTGEFWMPDYFDRFVRDEEHLAAVRQYIRQNPVKAGLVASPEHWKWSSAARRSEASAAPAGDTAGETPALPGKVPALPEMPTASKTHAAPSIGSAPQWRGAAGLAADVRYYGRLVLQRAREKIGHLYPKVHIVQEKDGTWRHATAEEVRAGRPRSQQADVIAWLWARTVASPNPAARGAHVPLVSTFWLSSKKGSLAWLEPVVDRKNNTWRFEVRTGQPADTNAVKQATKQGRGAQFRCILTDTPMADEHIRQEVIAKRCRFALTAIVADLGRGRVYLPVDARHAEIAAKAAPAWVPDEEMNENDPNLISGRGYGIKKWAELFTPRQLTALVTFSDLVREVRQDVLEDARDAGLAPKEADQYAKAVVTFLALALDRCADFNNALCAWNAANQKVMHLFGKQAIPMVWDFAEANIFGDCVGGWSTCNDYVADCVEVIGGALLNSGGNGSQLDAAGAWDALRGVLVSTDPPYYDNIGYAALSDFFYVWLRRTIGDLYPELFKTVLTPKEAELVAAPERFGGDRQKAREHFETGFRKAFTALREKMDPRFPLTVYYAFKQEDEEPSAASAGSAGAGSAGAGSASAGSAGVPPAHRVGQQSGRVKSGRDGRGPGDPGSSRVDRTTGWETLLEALLGSGFQITATWPVRASQKWRMVAMGTNALASYIVLACRPRPADAPQCTRREFIAELKKELPDALRRLQQGSIAPVDLAQASIGPGMAVFSRYAKVMESSGRAMTVRTALALINQTLDEVLAEQEAEFDADTRWALAWFEQHGMEEGPFGDAETLSKAKNTAVNGLVEAGIVSARGGKVRLVRREELPHDWDPATDERLTVWEMTQHLIRALEEGGESGAAELLRKLGARGEAARELCYRLHKIAERRGWASEAVSYNALAVAWPEIARLASSWQTESRGQAELFDEN